MGLTRVMGADPSHSIGLHLRLNQNYIWKERAGCCPWEFVKCRARQDTYTKWELDEVQEELATHVL
ncbi:hypothetical protein Pyn_05872 [Prunus yedoensis var. nudiflora]|uniref:Uncharacterized protein n=1 Tax=Prunus yedoensis var. nudiflora TaxID=2094558 RepID=A0A314Y824_PRUYE|nr:hypothetical protein Pyn_05872 [Prunus yedoensis var. nudiflora]